MVLQPDEQADHHTVRAKNLLEVLQRPGMMDDVAMTMTVYPQDLLTLVAWPEHLAPVWSSICVTYGPVSRVFFPASSVNTEVLQF